MAALEKLERGEVSLPQARVVAGDYVIPGAVHPTQQPAAALLI